ncbi:MAG: helix-turn-helix domain-containing protein [Firmicutes bacterium]|nr:helix-turn-helix domain-containing protein [Bacillota bacterium]
MSNFNDNLRSLRLDMGLTQGQLAHKIGTSQSSIGMYESGARQPNFETLEKLAKALDTDIEYLVTGRPRNETPYSKLMPLHRVRVPIVGDIACGEPIYAEEEYSGYIDTNDSTMFDFCLRCVGNSMINAGIKNGSLVFIRKQDIVENGEIAAVAIGSEVTLKRVSYYPDRKTLILKPDNPAYKDLIYFGSELDTIRILGKAVAVQNKL